MKTEKKRIKKYIQDVQNYLIDKFYLIGGTPEENLEFISMLEKLREIKEVIHDR